MHAKNKGFTIVELLIVIVIIAILAAIAIVAYNGIQQRSKAARRDADLSTLSKAIVVARYNTNKTLGSLTGNYWTIGGCIASNNNPTNILPSQLPKTHVCWQWYVNAINVIATASNTNLDSLKNGDPDGNPYGINENQGENSNCTQKDALTYSTGSGTLYQSSLLVPLGDMCP